MYENLMKAGEHNGQSIVRIITIMRTVFLQTNNII